MSVKVADTIKPMSNEFPAVEGVDIDVEVNGKTKRLQKAIEDGDLSGGGSTIQYDILPVPSEEYEGKIVQFVGDTGTYESGAFYKCVLKDDSYVWERVEDDISGNTVTFEEPEEYTEPESKETLATIIGKVVKAIKNLFASVGDLETLETEEKTSLVGATNEIFANLGEKADKSALDDKQNKNSALKHLFNAVITSANTTTSASPNYYIRVDGIPTDYTSATHVKSWKIRTRYNHSYELVITPWNNEGTNADKVLRLLATEGTGSSSVTVNCAYKFVTENDNTTMSIIFKVYCRGSATPFGVANMISEVGDVDNYTWTELGNDNEIVTLEDGRTMSCANYYATFTPCQKTELATMDKVAKIEQLTSTEKAKWSDLSSSHQTLVKYLQKDDGTQGIGVYVDGTLYTIIPFAKISM